MIAETPLDGRVGLTGKPGLGTHQAFEILVSRHSAPLALAAETPSVPARGRAAEQSATVEDTLPFAFGGRSGWGGPKKVKRAATLCARILPQALDCQGVADLVTMTLTLRAPAADNPRPADGGVAQR